VLTVKSPPVDKWHTVVGLILMDLCIVDYSVEIPTRCSFVIEFIISKFFEGSTCVLTVHQSRYLIQCPLGPGNDRSPYGHINQRLKIQFRAPDDERCAARNMLSLQKILE